MIVTNVSITLYPMILEERFFIAAMYCMKRRDSEIFQDEMKEWSHDQDYSFPGYLKC